MSSIWERTGEWGDFRSSVPRSRTVQPQWIPLWVLLERTSRVVEFKKPLEIFNLCFTRPHLHRASILGATVQVGWTWTSMSLGQNLTKRSITSKDKTRRSKRICCVYLGWLIGEGMPVIHRFAVQTMLGFTCKAPRGQSKGFIGVGRLMCLHPF